MEEYVNIGLDKYERLKMFENDRYERDAKEFLKQFINFTTIFGNQEKQYCTAHINKEELKKTD
ncbi:hypothetical protein [Listeria monocytogenes]|uniref:hypothetical protein n=1 Tax=Listeria monocytogenes TaxID=1639 RepID=UPI001E2D5198|nr:hypothetical protein [Listeria monocytogenes]MDN7316945.1 hypothetical protein [Listeria monocytogenes]MDN7320842.1 hypothetical protein [Listeria monocytogenes]MDN7336790.1 hypothetical protein [Listeria monocytogenes]MDN7339616.1 hypothetical protein [Listeria monocytogenes]